MVVAQVVAWVEPEVASAAVPVAAWAVAVAAWVGVAVASAAVPAVPVAVAASFNRTALVGLGIAPRPAFSHRCDRG